MSNLVSNRLYKHVDNGHACLNSGKSGRKKIEPEEIGIIALPGSYRANSPNSDVGYPHWGL